MKKGSYDNKQMSKQSLQLGGIPIYFHLKNSFFS